MSVHDNKTEPIRFEGLGNTIEDHCELRAELRKRLTARTILTARSHEELVRAVRRQFEDLPGRPDADWHEFAREVLSRVGADPTRSTRSLHEHFVAATLGYETLPSLIREMLLNETLEHLRHVEGLISFYEKLDAIVEYNRSSRVRDRKIVDFYQRCLNERTAISRYLATGLDHEVLRRADEDNWANRLFKSFREEPPYHLLGPRGNEYLDHRLINASRHRVHFLPIQRGRELGALYATDRCAFYEALLTERPIAILFDNFEATAKRFERVRARAPIFAEMQRLFNSEQWYGLYALTLPQVEGLFSEMGTLAAPSSTARGLKDRVSNVRRYALAHEHSLDYFEYVVPAERNSFAHTGTIADPQLRSIELLHDLAYICEIFTELDTPIVELCNLLAEPTALQEIHQWAHVFELVEEVKAKQQQGELGTKLEVALAALLPDEQTQATFAKIIGERLRTDTSEVVQHLATMAKERLGLTLDLTARKSQEIQQRAHDISEMIDELDALSGGAILRPLDVRVFAKGVLAYAKLTEPVRTEIESVLNEVARPLNNIASIMHELTRARS